MINSIQKNKYIYIYLLVQIILLAVPLGVPRGYEVVCGFIILWMFGGPYNILQGLSLIILIKYLNPAIVEQTFLIGIIGWIAVLIAAARSIFCLKLKMLKILGPLTFFVITVIILSIVVSPRFDVSLMKVIAFWVFVSSLLICSLSLKADEINKFKNWLICLFVVLILLSLPMYFIPSIGFNRNAAGFQGIMNHPQVFGTMLSPLAAWLIAGLVLDKNKLPILLWSLVLLTIACIFLSQARTGILALVLGLFFGFITSLTKNTININLHKSIMVGSLFVVVSLVTISVSSDIRSSVFSFMLKQDGKVSSQVETDQITQEFNASRGVAIKQHWEHFLSSPVAGTGYGVYPSGRFPKPIIYYQGIPISASVEKGFLPSMVLEEIGLVGALVFLYFLYKLSKYVFNNYDVRWVCMYLSCLFTNLGEATLFAVNGISQWYWLLIALCVAYGANSKWMMKLKL